MKKSNALMLSYIIFLLLTILVDIFTSWAGMERVALAATIAGAFFALADLTNWRVDSYSMHTDAAREKVQAHIDYCNAVFLAEENKKRELEEALDLLTPYSSKSERIAKALNDAQPLIAQMEQNLVKMKADNEDVGKLLESVDNMAETVNDVAKWESRYAICGFVSFFILLTFNKLVEIINPYGALVTVAAFFVIMITYYLRDNMDDTVKKTKEEVSQFISEHQAELEEREEELEEFPFLDAAKQLIKDVLSSQTDEETDNG